MNAIITGITGQDGAYLAQLLLEKGYTVHGTFRRTSSVNFWRIEELGIADHPQLNLVSDLTDLSSASVCCNPPAPPRSHNLAAQSCGRFFSSPSPPPKSAGWAPSICSKRSASSTRRFASPGVHLRNVRQVQTIRRTRTHRSIRAAYGAAKLYAHWMTVNYESRHLCRQRYPFQPRITAARPRFVTRKITDSIAKVKLRSTGVLGSATSTPVATGLRRRLRRPCGACCVDEPDTFVVATNRTETVRDFVSLSCRAAEIDIGGRAAASRSTVDTATGKTIVTINPLRPRSRY